MSKGDMKGACRSYMRARGYSEARCWHEMFQSQHALGGFLSFEAIALSYRMKLCAGRRSLNRLTEKWSSALRRISPS